MSSEDAVRIALVDGAGHGQAASEAANLALESLRASLERPLGDALRLCHHALHGSRGAAVSLMEVAGRRVVFAGIGNVEGRLVTPSIARRLVPQRGIAGHVIPTIRPETAELPDDQWALVLYSDGISQQLVTGWHSLASSPEKFVREALTDWARPTDDATVVLILSTRDAEGQ